MAQNRRRPGPDPDQEFQRHPAGFRRSQNLEGGVFRRSAVFKARPRGMGRARQTRASPILPQLTRSSFSCFRRRLPSLNGQLHRDRRVVKVLVFVGMGDVVDKRKKKKAQAPACRRRRQVTDPGQGMVPKGWGGKKYIRPSSESGGFWSFWRRPFSSSAMACSAAVRPVACGGHGGQTGAGQIPSKDILRRAG